jgi:hypothetical protein
VAASALAGGGRFGPELAASWSTPKLEKKEKQVINKRKNGEEFKKYKVDIGYEETIYGGVFHKITMPHQQ